MKEEIQELEASELENANSPEVENENSSEPQKDSFGAKLKEWCRKQIVSLKRAPQNIALVVLVATTIYFLMILFPLSLATSYAANDEHTPAIGICVFISTLLSILVLVSFLNAFPKRKKANIFFVVLVFVMIGASIGCDLAYYLQMNACLEAIKDNATGTMYVNVSAAQPYMMGHIIMLGVSAVVFALVPVWKILINMINTSVKLESATENMQGQIDIQEG